MRKGAHIFMQWRGGSVLEKGGEVSTYIHEEERGVTCK